MGAEESDNKRAARKAEEPAASRVARIKSAMQHEGEVTWSMQKGPAKFAAQKAVFINSNNQRRRQEEKIRADGHIH